MDEQKDIQFTEDLDQGFSVSPDISIEGFIPDDGFFVEPEVENPYSDEELAIMNAELERQNEINTAKQILNQTDYYILKAAEELIMNTLASTPQTLNINSIGVTSNELIDMILLRREQRDKINELE